MALYRDQAVVLRTFDLGEADRIIVLLTKAHGKVRAVAKGVRRQKSRFGGRLEPFMCVDVMLVERKSLDIVSQVVSLAAFAEPICRDYRLYQFASLMLEVVDALSADEHQDVSSQYQLLVAALSSLARHRHEPDAIGFSYVLRAMSRAGWSPVLHNCVVCGQATKMLTYFSAAYGGMMCATDHTPDAVACSEHTRLQLTALLQGDWHSIDGKEIEAPTVDCIKRWYEYYLERPLRSLRFVDDALRSM